MKQANGIMWDVDNACLAGEEDDPFKAEVLVNTSNTTRPRQVGARSCYSCRVKGEVPSSFSPHANLARLCGTENLTCRFIQLRKENGKLFTGRKYSAQAGWEFILRQMREEFPTIMADVHYRVLKKKWSNLLQQYKELKNPVHGDRNKSDDVSWPFYSAIDEVLGYSQRHDDDDVNPHEFLCVSVTPEEPASPEDGPRAGSDGECDCEDTPSIAALQRLQALNEDCSIEIERLPRVPLSHSRSTSGPSHTVELRKRDANDTLVSRLPRATELSIKTVKPATAPSVCVKDFSRMRTDRDGLHLLREALVVTTQNGNPSASSDDGETPQKLRRTRYPEHQEHDCGVERRLAEFLEYTKRRDEENRSIMMRILHAVEKIANK